ncbi:Hypothetical predicted protein [Cloeon dipterum]|uniref:Uncharacterized protein n=1 Tax=Cloeon dipterum TaxID=197152 RepID=A0A8S1DHY3_9INSE|nr:Hypothetical predicted protein [Cloeon dipterum]
MEENKYSICGSDSSSEFQEEEKIANTFGSKLLFLVHLVCGQYLNLPTPRWRINPALKLIIGFYGAVSFLGVTFFVTVTASTLVKNLQDFENAVMLTAGFFGFLQCFLRIVYTTVRKGKIEEIAEKVHRALNRHGLQKDSVDFNKKLSRLITVLLLFWSSSFAVAVISIVSDNIKAVDQVLEYIAANETGVEKTKLNDRLTFETTLTSTKVIQRLGVPPSQLAVRLIMAALLTSNYVAIGRLIVSDVLFYSWYSVLVHQYQQLIDCLPEAIADGGKKMNYWAHYHTVLNE